MPTSADDTLPRDSASLVIVRDGAAGLEVLLLQRSRESPVAASAYVFPGGKLERADSAPGLLRRLDVPAATLAHALGEPQTSVERAAGLYVAALREAAEEAQLLYVTGALTAERARRACACLQTGTPFPTLLDELDLPLAAHALIPWSRWITPRGQHMMERRFDTRFFLVSAPAGQSAAPDAHEVTSARWWTPDAALAAYRERRIRLIPPQIVSLLDLRIYGSAAAALAAARARPVPRIEPVILHSDAGTTMCYPGDPEHPVPAPHLPAHVPSRLVLHDGLFRLPPQGGAPVNPNPAPVER